MKKTLLFISAVVTGFFTYAQTAVVAGVSPASIAGGYEFAFQSHPGWPGAQDNGTWGLTLDFNVPGTYIQAEVQLVNDGTPGVNADYGNLLAEEGCAASTPGSLTGKIALIRRNTCGFADKALNAQNAGAIAVIVVGRDEDLNISLSGGNTTIGPPYVGTDVTIPVVMVKKTDGDALIAESLVNPVVMFIGNKSGAFQNDASIRPGGTLISKSTGVLSQLSQNASEFGFDIGTQLFNDGSAAQSNIIVNAKVTNPAGATVYDQNVTVTSLAANDSVYLYPGEAQSFPAFSLSSYPAGRYTLTYTVGLDAANDDYPADNVITNEFVVNDSIFSYSALNSVNNLPAGSGGYRPSTNNSTFSICNVISDANASRIGVEGMYFALVTNAADSIDLTGEEIALNLYEWADVFTGLDDPNVAFNVLNPLSYGYYYYPSDLQDSMVYGALETPVVLEDGKRYLACAQTVNLNVFFRYDTRINYTMNVNDYLQPLYPVESDGTYSAGGFGSDNAPAMAVKVFNASELSVAESNVVNGVAYPNPAVDNITVSLNAEGNALITMTDVAGRIVLTKSADLVNGKTDLNIAALNSGVYVVNVVLENGKTAQFNVVKK
jgi:hypothetical protein